MSVLYFEGAGGTGTSASDVGTTESTDAGVD
jgi:hypothetical protein